MAAYATPRLTLASEQIADGAKAVNLDADGSMLDAIMDQLADRVAQRLAIVLERGTTTQASDEWLDSRRAADYLGVHRDTLRKLAAERAISSEQDGPNCKLYFRRSDLDAWRRSGGRPRHLTTALQRVA